MPLASHSLRDRLESGPLNFSEARQVLEDVADALSDLQASGVVHRDLKPENILWLDGAWCVADFGISRYAEAATAAAGTHKYSWTPAYASPEQWRFEHATPAADVYALGIIAFEIVVGEVPYKGSFEDLHHAHLHSPVPTSNTPKKLAWLIEECLTKAQGYRPSPQDFRKRLVLALSDPASPGLAALQEANQANAQQAAELIRRQSEARTEQERRSALADAGSAAFARFSSEVLDALKENAPRAEVTEGKDGSWKLSLTNATLELKAPVLSRGWGSSDSPPFDVIQYSTMRLTTTKHVRGYTGREHSLWFADVGKDNEFRWFETAFINFVMMAGSQPSIHPFALIPGQSSAEALQGGIMHHQHAWPLTEIDPYDLTEFISRWAKWLAQAAEGKLFGPTTLPERSPGRVRNR